jgi:hypothetical protein
VVLVGNVCCSQRDGAQNSWDKVGCLGRMHTFSNNPRDQSTIVQLYSNIIQKSQYLRYLVSVTALLNLPDFGLQYGPSSSVGIVTGYGLDGLGIESRWGRDFPHLSRLVLGPTQPPVQWVPDFSRGQKAAGAWC